MDDGSWRNQGARGGELGESMGLEEGSWSYQGY